MGTVILLNADYSFLNTISVEKAFTLIAKAKVQILENTDKVIRSVYNSWPVPKIMRLLYIVRVVYRNKVPWTPRNIFIRDNYTCQYCGAKLTVKQSECEHIIPRSRSGKSTFENTVCSCHRCNQRKADKTPREAGMGLKRQPYQPTIMEFIQIRLKSSGINDILKEFYKKVS